jgi:hypothetical protein
LFSTYSPNLDSLLKSHDILGVDREAAHSV